MAQRIKLINDTSLHSSENVETELEEAGGEVIFRVNEGSFGQDVAVSQYRWMVRDKSSLVSLQYRQTGGPATGKERDFEWVHPLCTLYNASPYNLSWSSRCVITMISGITFDLIKARLIAWPGRHAGPRGNFASFTVKGSPSQHKIHARLSRGLP